MAGLVYRKIVRDAILAFLVQKFNAGITALAEVYQIEPFSLDFSPESENFAVSHIDPSNIETCQIQWGTGMNVGGCLYTTEGLDTGIPRGFSFAGRVMANLDFYVRDRDGAEGFNTEDFFDAIEDAALGVLNNPANQWPAGVNCSRQSELGREFNIPLGDGFATRIPIKSLFEVRVP
jgi:hypothetical protein